MTFTAKQKHCHPKKKKKNKQFRTKPSEITVLDSTVFF